MSGAQTSSAPNVLFDPLMAGRQQAQQNTLMQQQQELSQADLEQESRAANFIMTVPPEQRPMAYQAAIAQLRPMGYAKNAPDEYPGDQANEWLARQSIPVPDQYKLGIVTPPGTAAAINAALTRGNAPAQGAQPPVTSATPSGTIEPAALTNANAVRDGLIKRGMDVDTATAFAANALHESVANPNTGPGDGGASHGLFQWNGDRAAGFQAMYGHSPDSAPLDEQLDYVMHELNGPESLAKGRIAMAQGVAGKAAEVSQAYLRPKDVVPEMQRRSATALQLQRQNAQPGQGGQTTAVASAAGGPVVVGDSLASKGGLGGNGVVGAQPSAVRAQIAQNGGYASQDVVLSSGASNAPGDMANVEGQLQLLRNASSVKLLGVGPGVEAKNPGTNAALQKLAAQYGAQFVPLPTDQMSPDGVHPNAQGYAALKAATAPPGTAPQAGRYQVASNAPVAPPGSTAPATGAQVVAQSGQPPAPATAAAQQPWPQTNLPHASEVPTGPSSPQYQQAMDLQRRAMILDAQPDPTGRLKTLAAGLRSQAQLILQSDSVVQTQEGQVHVLTGAIDKTAAPLPVWQQRPDGTWVDVSGGGAKPDTPPSPRSVDGEATWDGQKWTQTQPGQKGTPGKWTIGGGVAPTFYPAATAPAQGSYDQQQSDYREDRKLLPEIAAQGQNAQTAQIRLQTMLDLLPKISTGAGGYTRTQLANLAETAGFPGIAQALIAHNSEGDAAAAQEFGKLTLAAAGAAERGDLGSRGSLGALKLYQQNNPSLDLRPGANKAMIGMQLIAAQADTDYSQGALAWAKEHGTNFRSGTGEYKPLTEFDLQWQQQRNPAVYAAAMGALNGQPPETWAKGLNKDDYNRALDIVARASPNAVVNTREGRKVMQQKTAAIPPMPPGYTVVPQ